MLLNKPCKQTLVNRRQAVVTVLKVLTEVVKVSEYGILLGLCTVIYTLESPHRSSERFQTTASTTHELFQV